MAELEAWGKLSSRDDAFVGLLEQNEPVGIGNRVRFDHSKQQWHIWAPGGNAGLIWAPDKRGLIYDLVRDCYNVWAREFAERGDADSMKLISAILDKRKKEAVLASLATRPQIAMAGNEWDPDPHLLAFANGVLDLRDLTFDRHPSPDLLLSRSTRQDYDPDAQAPRFEQFLQEVMGNDAGLSVYLAAVLGYSMFGWQREQKFWMWVGQGQNGKGTLAKVMSYVMGDYAEKPSDELYMRTKFGASASDKPRPDLLRLQGARWTWISEPQGGQFNEELLKAHTGDDPITARDLYGKAASYTTFRPTHTVVVLTNNPPRTDDTGPSMRRRVRIVQFGEDFRGSREDKGLEASLKEEAPGILALLSRMARRWYEAGELPEPTQVTEWSDRYIEENDPLTAFIEEGCVLDHNAVASGGALWSAYQTWCDKRDEKPGTMTTFGLSLARRFVKSRGRSGMAYQGVRPKSAMEIAEAEVA